MKFVDLFAGIGGFHYAVKELWPKAKCVFASEIDKNAAETYRINHGIDPLNDITQTDISALPASDLVCAGFPCQAFSKNGKWYNFGQVVGDDDRANLFPYVVEYLRIHQPQYALLENVKGLAEMKNQDGSFYLDAIRENMEGAGYKVHVKVLDTADYGLPQQRKRTYFVCLRDGGDFEWPKPQPRFHCVEDILDDAVDPKYYLKNRWAGRMCKTLPGTRLEQLRLDYEKRIENFSGTTGSICLLAAIYGDSPSGSPRQQDKLYSVYGISPTLGTWGVSIPNFDAHPHWRTLTPRE
ncbi:MAG: DNA (cytosine-5-)-methyltransferase, partial [bacterium]